MSTPSFDYLTTPIGNRRILVEASAGTGKTFALTGLVVRLVLEGVELKKILVVTFTNAATAELKTRIRLRLREVLAAFRHPHDTSAGDAGTFLKHFRDQPDARRRLEAALLDIDEASVFTIHGFCQRVLQQSAFESGAPFEAELTEDADDLFDRAVADFLSLHTYDDRWGALMASRLDEKKLRDHYKTFSRYPDARLEPDTGPLRTSIESLTDAVNDLRTAWHSERDRTIELLSSIKWKKDSEIQNDDLGVVVASIESSLKDAPHKCIADIGKLATSHLLNHPFKSTPSEKLAAVEADPLLGVCDRVSIAFDNLEKSFIHSFLVEVDSRFAELKQTAGVLTFDDLLERVDNALADDSDIRDRLLASIRSRWTHALIDEFQDTDPRQYRIFQTAFDGRPAVFVGDPKQAIYSFRGADLHAYLAAKEDAERQEGGPHRYMLDKNWRSASKLVEAVNVLFSLPPEHPFLLDGVPYERVEPAGSADQKPLEGDGVPPMVWWMLPPPEGKHWTKPQATDLVNRGVVNGIKELLSNGATIDGRAVEPSNIAILVRANKEGEALQRALGEENIPAVISKGGSVWVTDEASGVEHLLRAFLRPSDRTSLCTALTTHLWGYDAAMVHAVRQDEDQMEVVRGKLAAYRQTWRQHGVMRAMSQFIEETNVTERLLGHRGGERRLTNVRHILELLHEEESRHNRGPDELVQWLRTRESRTADDSDATELRLETDADAIQIVTVHKSKGLQYDIVIAPFLWSAKEKHKSNACVLVHEDDGSIIYDIGSEDAQRRQRLADAERLSEDLRLAYVALTRAVHRCYVVWGEANQAEMSAPAYLLGEHLGQVQADGIQTDDLAERAKQAFTAGSDSAGIINRLQALAEMHPDVMAVSDLPQTAPSYRRKESDGLDFRPRALSDEAKSKLEPWSITSYSRLAAGDPFEPAFAFEDGRRSGFFAFAAGRVPGNCLHEIIEEVDIAALPLIGTSPVPQVERLVERKLRAFGLLDPARHRGGDGFDPQREVMRFLGRLGHTPIPLAGVTLPELDPRRTLREWGFLVPIGAITPEALAKAVANHADDPFLRSEYPQRLRRLTQQAVDGYLTGVADFAFEHDGRWYVFDWKSTNLGAHYADYAPDRLQEAAVDRHYVFQLLVYALGLHRYLQTRMPDYDYDRHIGGAGVVFLRGIDGETSNGFYVLRPPAALIGALDEMLQPVPA